MSNPFDVSRVPVEAYIYIGAAVILSIVVAYIIYEFVINGANPGKVLENLVKMPQKSKLNQKSMENSIKTSFSELKHVSASVRLE